MPKRSPNSRRKTALLKRIKRLEHRAVGLQQQRKPKPSGGTPRSH